MGCTHILISKFIRTSFVFLLTTIILPINLADARIPLEQGGQSGGGAGGIKTANGEHKSFAELGQAGNLVAKKSLVIPVETRQELESLLGRLSPYFSINDLRKLKSYALSQVNFVGERRVSPEIRAKVEQQYREVLAQDLPPGSEFVIYMYTAPEDPWTTYVYPEFFDVSAEEQGRKLLHEALIRFYGGSGTRLASVLDFDAELLKFVESKKRPKLTNPMPLYVALDKMGFLNNPSANAYYYLTTIRQTGPVNELIEQADYEDVEITSDGINFSFSAQKLSDIEVFWQNSSVYFSRLQFFTEYYIRAKILSAQGLPVEKLIKVDPTELFPHSDVADYKLKFTNSACIQLSMTNLTKVNLKALSQLAQELALEEISKHQTNNESIIVEFVDYTNQSCLKSRLN